MDEGTLHSRAERYIRSLRVIPDRWWFDGTDIHMLYGNQFYQAPFGSDFTFASEGDEGFADEIFVNPGDEERSPMEISDGLQTQYRLAVSICPDYIVGDSQPQAIRDSMVFIQRLILQDRMDASSAYPQFDTVNNEIDIVFTQPVDYEDMISLHRRLTNAVEEADINAYVYAEFAGSLAADFYPLTYGYPSGRQAMLGRSWAAESQTFESSVVIPPTSSIVERVRAMQEALQVSQMQSKLIDLQTRAKLGMIRTEEELMELLLGAESFEAPPKVPKPAPASGTMRRCSKCGQTGHNSRTCRSPEPKEGIFDRCPHCNDPGHRRDDCPDAPVREWEQPDPRDVEGFEPLVRGESKLAKGARIKRNIRRILEQLSYPPWSSELVGAYRHNGGDTPWVRSESKRVPGAARNIPEVLVWRDRYYLLGPGGKEEFFRTGPGSLQG